MLRPCGGEAKKSVASLALALLGVAGCGHRPASGVCSDRFAVTRRHPEIELVVDRSCAMTQHFDGTPGTGADDPATRYAVLRAAVAALPPSIGLAGLSLVLSPDGAECETPIARVTPGTGSVGEVLAALDAAAPDLFDGCAGTPAGFGLEPGLQAIVDSDTVGDAGDPFTVVIVASAPVCGETHDTLAALVSDVGTDVAFVTLGVDAATGALIDGLGERHDASSSNALRTTLEEVARSRISCILDVVGGTPADPDLLRVWADGTLVPADPDEGWSYSAGENALTFNGSYCDRLTSGAIHQISTGVGCDQPLCVPQAEHCDGLDEDCDGVVDNGCS